MPPDDLSARLLVIFAEELDEQVQQLNEALLALERNPGDASCLQAVFRVMHTLKGASRAAGLSRVEELCHTIENDLSRARDRKAPLGGAQLALLFETADALGEVRDRLRAGQPVLTTSLDVALAHARGERMPAAIEIVNEPPATATKPVRAAQPAARVEEPAVTAHTEETRIPEFVRVGIGQIESIAGTAGELSSLVSTLQDRTADIALVRTHVRDSRGRDDAQLAGELNRELTVLLRRVTETTRALSAVSGRLGVSTRRLRQRPLSELTEIFPRVVRDVAHDLGKQVRLVVAGGEIEADRVVLEALRDPMLHLIRNAIDHGLESTADRAAAGKEAEGTIRITGALRGDRLRVTVSDDGAGVDVAGIRARLERAGRRVPADAQSVVETIFDDGFSTRDVATTVSGRGVGLGIVRAAVEKLGGGVEVEWETGKGTSIAMDVPVSVSTMNVLLVAVDEHVLGIPTSAVVRVMRAKRESLSQVDGRPMLRMDDAPIPVRSLASVLGAPFRENEIGEVLQIVIVENAGKRVALVVDELRDERELILRPIENIGASKGAMTVGATLLGSGEVALVLSPAALAAPDDRSQGALIRAANTTRAPATKILVVDDSITSRTLEQSVLAAAGYDVSTAVDGAEAWRFLERQTVALVVSDVEMPHVSGIELCTRIRAHEKTAALPVILVTSLDAPAERARGLEAGADAYLTKSSFDQNTLLDTIKMLIGRAGDQQ